MGKNRSYKNVYEVTISGKTTNGFTAKILDNIIRTVVIALGYQSAQSQIDIECVETKGDYDAIAREYKENI